jgi:hypothetical protein
MGFIQAYHVSHYGSTDSALLYDQMDEGIQIWELFLLVRTNNRTIFHRGLLHQGGLENHRNVCELVILCF